MAFLGGGQPGGSTVLDLLDVSTGAVRTNATALPRYKGRWGTSCAGCKYPPRAAAHHTLLSRS